MIKENDKTPIILQVLPEIETGGVEIGTIEIASELQKQGIKNFVASKGGLLEYELNKIGVVHFKLPLKSKNIFTMLKNAKKLKKIIKENGINIVHARSRAPAWSAYWAAKKAGVKFLTTFHGTYGLGPKGIKKIYNKVMTYGQLVIAISEHIKKHMLKNYKIDEKKIRLIHRCVNIDKFSPEAVSPERMIKAIEKYNIPEDKQVIVLGGRLTHWKGQHLLIEALSKMKNTNYYCIIAGAGQGREDYVNRLKNMARKYNLESRVIISSEVVTDMPALFMASNIVLSTAIEPEAFGRMSIEGQAMGKLTIASNIGGSLESIQNDVTGKLFENNNAQSLADALDWALDLPALEKQKISKAAIKNVKDNFTKQMMCDKTIRVYNELLNMN